MIGLEQQLIGFAYVCLAALLGGLIGWEREVGGKPAGLRTHMLVCGGSALFVVLGTQITLAYQSDISSEIIRTDPVRVIQAIAVGVSFIGAGTIIQNNGQDRPRYLTTAASILFTSAIGVAVGLRQIVLGVASALLVFLVMWLLGILEDRWVSRE